MKKRFFKAPFLLIMAIITIVSLSGCSGKSDSPSDSAADSEKPAKQELVTLNFATFQSGSNPGAPFMKKMVEDFNKKYENQIVVKVDEIPDDAAYVNKMKVLLASGDLPDITYGKGGILDLVVKANLATDLTPYMNSDDTWKASITQPVIEANSRDGKLYSVSDQVGVTGYFYNKEMFTKAGITPALTWDEFFANADKLKAAGLVPITCNTSEGGWTANLLLGALVGTSNDAGMKFMNTIHPKNYETPEVIEALRKMQTIMQKYATTDCVGSNYGTSVNNFNSENAAIISNGPWMIGGFSDTAQAKEGFDKKVGYAAFPGKGMYNAVFEGYMVTAKDQAHKDAAVEFVKFLTDDNAQLLALQMLDIPPMSPTVQIPEEFKKEKPILAELLAENSAAKYRFSYFDNINYANISDELSKLYPALANNKITPEDFAKQLSAAAQKND